MDEVDSAAAARRGRRSGSDELRRVGGEMKGKIIRFHKNKRKE